MSKQFLESDWESNLLMPDLLGTANTNQSEELEDYDLLEIETGKFWESDSDFAWFSDSEIETSSLYSDSPFSNDNHTDFLEAESDTEFESADTNTETNNLVKTFGNPEQTQFTFNFADNTPQEIIDGVQQAAEIWSSILKDDVNINIDFSFEPLEEDLEGLNAIGGIVSSSVDLSYALVREALAQDVSSLDDSIAIASLPDANSLNLLMNNTSENNGSDSPYLDDNNGFNNSHIRINTANAKALGLDLDSLAQLIGVTPEEFAAEFGIDVNLPDAQMIINSETSWDFDRSDGIDADANDFIGTVVHEIGHALGFVTGTSELDIIASSDLGSIINASGSKEVREILANTGLEGLANAVAIDQFISENEYLPETLDLFRFTPESFEQGARDFTTGNIGNKYFSIDGGFTEIAPLSTGVNTGDGHQLSHWKDNLNIGLLDPTIEPGINDLSSNDLLAFDVIGWDIA